MNIGTWAGEVVIKAFSVNGKDVYSGTYYVKNQWRELKIENVNEPIVRITITGGDNEFIIQKICSLPSDAVLE